MKLSEIDGREVVVYAVKRDRRQEVLRGKAEVYPRFILVHGLWRETFLLQDLATGRYAIKVVKNDGKGKT